MAIDLWVTKWNIRPGLMRRINLPIFNQYFLNISSSRQGPAPPSHRPLLRTWNKYYRHAITVRKKKVQSSDFTRYVSYTPLDPFVDPRVPVLRFLADLMSSRVSNLILIILVLPFYCTMVVVFFMEHFLYGTFYLYIWNNCRRSIRHRTQ